MAIWRGTTAVPTIGPGVHLKFKVLSGGDQWSAGATRAVGDARLMMRYMLGKLKNGWNGLSDDQKAVGDYYFQLGGGAPNGTEFDIIRQTLQMTSNGLFGGGLNVKVTVEDTANGYVGMHDGRFGILEKLREKTGGKSRWTPGTHIQAQGGPRLTKMGDIHLDSDAIDKSPAFAALTLIHEATHKFASTGDYRYVAESTGQYEGPITKAQALNNADSYAYFVVGAFQERPT